MKVHCRGVDELVQCTPWELWAELSLVRLRLSVFFFMGLMEHRLWLHSCLQLFPEHHVHAACELPG